MGLSASRHYAKMAIETAALPDWTMGISYSVQLESSGGTGNHSWSDQNGGLTGTGLALSADGLISGTPLNAGAILLIAEVGDDVGASTDTQFDFSINTPVQITSSSQLPDATEGMTYSLQLQSSGGTGSTDWVDRYDDLNGTGLSLGNGGLLTGTPSSFGLLTFTAKAEDQVGSYDELMFSLTVERAWLCGDADGNTIVEISDAVYLANYVFVPGSPEPDPYESGDADCSGVVEISDAVFLISYVFVPGSPPPCDTDNDGEPDC